MKSAENHRAAACLLKLLSVNGVRINPLVAYQRQKHLVVLLLDSKVQRRLPTLVAHIEVKDAAIVCFVHQSHVL